MSQTAQNRMLINATDPEEIRVATIENNKLCQLEIETPYQTRLKGNIYLAAITSIAPSLNAVFVDFGAGSRHGFLPFKEIHPRYYNHEDNIADTLKVGQELLVQVEKSERANKGAALTTHISLAGTFLVIRPGSDKGFGISKQAELNEREQLKATLNQLVVPHDLGVIVRTAGINQSAKELQWDLDTLVAYWKSIQQATEQHQAPCLIHQESSTLVRAIRDNLKPSIDQIIVDDAKTFAIVQEYIRLSKADFIEKLVHHNHAVPLFTHYQIEPQIEQLHERTVHLPSGGSIVIDLTEAMTAIDVNSARATSAGDIESTAYQTNLEAAQEACRQIRLRDIGGIIMIDFIDMESKKHRKEVEKVIAQNAPLDKAKIRFEPIMELNGVLPLSRQRVKSTVEQDLFTTCPTCNGTGYLRSLESYVSFICRLIEDHVIHDQAQILQVQLAIEPCTYLINKKKSSLQSIEARYGVQILIIPNPQLGARKHLIKRIKSSNHSTRNLLDPTQRETERPTPNWVDQSPPEQPQAAVDLSLDQQYIGRNRQRQTSPLKKLWQYVFTENETQQASVKSKNQSEQNNTRPPQTKQSGRRTRRNHRQRRRSSSNKSTGSHHES